MRSLRPLAGLALVTVTIPIAAGCGGAADPGTDPRPATVAAPAGGAVADDGGDGGSANQAVRFSACMRENGVEDFPDPDASGELTVDGIANHSSIDTGSPAWKSAIDACRELQPAGFTGRERSGEQQEAALDFARCMRENGVRDFPDPAPDAPLVDTTRIPSAAGRGARDMPELQAAMGACSSRFSDELGLRDRG